MKKQYFKRLSDLTMDDIPYYGGKACTLGTMLRAGIPIPNGFAVSIDLQKDYQDRPFPESILQQINALYSSLKLHYVAVRSSAVAEDKETASWAGQLESYLYVKQDNLEYFIRECWASIKSSHASEYGRDKGLGEDDYWVGVLIQEMVHSDLSGVMFTVDPTTGANSVLIEGIFGLGELIVQGIVTPDKYVIDKTNQEIGYHIEIKSKKMVFQEGRIVELRLPIEVGDRAVLDDKKIRKLVQVALLVEQYFGKPMDIEWAYAEDAINVVQARPITTL